MLSVYLCDEKCCGCKGCVNACPVNAISMRQDEFGYEYPVIDQDKCIDCGKCQTVCPMQHINGKCVEDVYAAVLKDRAVENSASGGAFFAIARSFLEKGGVVFGSAFDERLNAEHIEVQSVQQLSYLQGSKYVQSDLDCHQRVLSLLREGKEVLFSGTPCQVASIKRYVGAYESRLFCIELICHGVPNAAFWQDYLGLLRKKHRGEVVGFQFRSKKYSMKFGAQYTIEKKGKKKTYIVPSVLSYYYHSFLKGKTYRKSCYSCPFAAPKRQADITLGDFWGYAGDGLQAYPHRSAVLVCSDKGRELLQMASNSLMTEGSSFEAVSLQNMQLIHPMPIERYDEALLRYWKAKGSEALDRSHKRKHWKACLFFRLFR